MNKLENSEKFRCLIYSEKSRKRKFPKNPVEFSFLVAFPRFSCCKSGCWYCLVYVIEPFEPISPLDTWGYNERENTVSAGLDLRPNLKWTAKRKTDPKVTKSFLARRNSAQLSVRPVCCQERMNVRMAEWTDYGMDGLRHARRIIIANPEWQSAQTAKPTGGTNGRNLNLRSLYSTAPITWLNKRHLQMHKLAGRLLKLSRHNFKPEGAKERENNQSSRFIINLKLKYGSKPFSVEYCW